MNRAEFMRQLESLLQSIAPMERDEALQYYNDYFDDAGAENEQEVIEALGNPARVAENIRRDLLGNGYGEGAARKAKPSDRALVEYGKEAQDAGAENEEPGSAASGGAAYGGGETGGAYNGGNGAGSVSYNGAGTGGAAYGGAYNGGSGTGGTSYNGGTGAGGASYNGGTGTGGAYNGGSGTGDTSYNGGSGAGGTSYNGAETGGAAYGGAYNGGGAGSTSNGAGTGGAAYGGAYNGGSGAGGTSYNGAGAGGASYGGDFGGGASAACSPGGKRRWWKFRKADMAPLPPWAIALLVTLVCLGSPVWLGILLGGIGVLFGAAGTLLALIAGWFVMIFAFGAVVIGMLVMLVVLVVTGVMCCFTDPWVGMALIGSGLVCGAIGIAFLMLTVAMAGIVTPAIFKGLGYLFRALFRKKPVKGVN